uniref:protein kinase domain-containing protein n=1 Tax=Alistipes sp. TaxID=1872444 RepID=UPI004056BB06
MQLKPGTFLQGDKYRIIRMLGSGGFGITYLAEHVMAKHKVCIKEFFPKEYYNRDEDSCSAKLGSEGSAEMMNIYKAKFIKEAQIIASLNHPNIIHIHDVFTENNTAYYVMEYIAGESLKDVVKLRGALPEAEAVKYIRAVSKAVEYIHERRIMHLDIKPANVMLRAEDDCPILIDFGISKHYDENSGEATSKTPVGKSRGFTPMEQYKEGGVNTFSPETDIYSLGATLYYLVTGTIPPQASDVLEDGLPALPSHLSAGVRRAITTAMQSRRKDRPHSIAEFLGLLDFVDNASEMDTYSECTIPDAVASEAIVADIKKPQPEPKWSLNNKHIELKNGPTISKRWFVWIIVAMLAIGAGITLFTSNNKPTDEAKPSVSDENLVIMEAADEVAVESKYTTPTPPNNEIWYTSSCGVIDPEHIDVFGASVISNTYKNGKGVITFDGPVTTIRGYCYNLGLKSVTIPDSVTTIGDRAFSSCYNLTSVNIGNSVTTIGSYAFFGCRNLTSVTIPDSVTTIGGGAFFGCTSLTSITIGDSVTTIGKQAFRDCTGLTSITIPDSVMTIGEEIFLGCNGLKIIYCKATTPPTPFWDYFDYRDLGDITIYVPRKSVGAYKDEWWYAADDIVGYDFED